jgi:hypothetical protein
MILKYPSMICGVRLSYTHSILWNTPEYSQTFLIRQCLLCKFSFLAADRPIKSEEPSACVPFFAWCMIA